MKCVRLSFHLYKNKIHSFPHLCEYDRGSFLGGFFRQKLGSGKKCSFHLKSQL